MAYEPTIQDIAVYSRLVNKYEQKVANIGAFECFRANSANAIPELNQLLSKYMNPNAAAKFAVLKKEAPTITNVRALSFSPAEGVSAYYSIVWATIVGGIGIQPSAFAGNDIAYQEALMKKLEALEIGFLTQMDTLAVAALDAAKNQVDQTSAYPYSFGTNTYGITLAQRDSFLYTLQSIMQRNDIESGQFDLVGSFTLQPYLESLKIHGQYNDVNKAMHIAGNDYYFSNRIAPGSGKEVTAYAMPKGSLAFASFIEDDCKQNIDLGGEKWFKMALPMSGIEVGIYEKAAGVDRSGVEGVGFERAFMRKWQAALDVAFIVPYSSDRAAITAPIHKFQIATT